MTARRDQIDDAIAGLRDALRGDVERVAEELLGPRNKKASSKGEWRWGAHGSLALVVRGHKRGLWRSYDGGESGDLLDLIRRERGGDFREAVAWTAARYGLPDPFAEDQEDAREASSAEGTAAAEAKRREREAKRAKEDAWAAAEDARALREAREWAVEAVPVSGTTGEYYLTRTRRIPVPDGGWPDCVRWLGRDHALLLVATGPDGAVNAVQRVFLDDAGDKLGAEDLEARGLPSAKLTRGRFGDAHKNTVVRLPGDPAGPLLLAEGPETGLSAWASTGFETWISMGSVCKLRVPRVRPVLVLRDDDPRVSTSAKALRDARVRWLREGARVVVAAPWTVRRGKKQDYNDLIQEEGPEAVRGRIVDALGFVPPPRPVRVSAAQARKMLDRVADDFYADTFKWNTEPADEPGDTSYPVHAVKITVGGGKTRAFVGKMHRLLRDLAEVRTGDAPRKVGAIAVPTHALGDQGKRDFEDLDEVREAVGEARRLGLTARVYRGRDALDPEAPGYADPAVPRADKARMCTRLDAVRDAIAAGATPVQTACCKSGKRACPAFDGCAFQRQMADRPDAWFVPHQLRYMEKPEVLGDLACVIVDEDDLACGLAGADAGGKPIKLHLESLNPAGLDQTTPSMQELALYRRKAEDLLSAVEVADRPVPLPRAAALAAGLTAGGAAIARKAEWMRYVKPKMWPGMPEDERRAQVEACAGNADVKRLVGFWTALEALLAEDGPEASGYIAVAVEQTKDGPVRVLYLKRRREIRKGWQVPTLYANAGFDIRLVRPFHPQVRLVLDMEIEAPHQRVHQVVNDAFALNKLIPHDGADEATVRACARNRRRLHATLMRLAWTHRPAPGQNAPAVLFVLQKAVREALAAEFAPFPPWVDVGHHNGLRGRNDWKSVRLLVVVGRTMPKPFAVRLQAEALTGRAVAHDDVWYERVSAKRERADGTFEETETDRHPDELCEALRWQACEGELLQDIGRGRGVNRTAADPLDVLLMTDAVLPLPVHTVLSAEDLAPSPDDLMLAHAGVVLEDPADAADAFPFWKSRWSVERAREAHADAAGSKGHSCAVPMLEPIYIETAHECPFDRPVPFAYRRAGDRTRTARGWCHPERLPVRDAATGERHTPQSWLAEALGDLIWVQVGEAAAEGAEPAGDAARTPGVCALMAARGAVLGSATDAVAAYGDLFPKGVEAAKQALRRAAPGEVPAGFVEVEYRPEPCPAVPKPKTRRAFVHPTRLAGFRAWIEGVVGPLVHYAAPDLPPEPPPPPRPTPPRPPPPPAGHERPDPARVEHVEPVPSAAPVPTPRGLLVAVPVRQSPGDDGGDWPALGPVLRGGAVPAFGASWRGSGGD